LPGLIYISTHLLFLSIPFLFGSFRNGNDCNLISPYFTISFFYCLILCNMTKMKMTTSRPRSFYSCSLCVCLRAGYASITRETDDLPCTP
jgi:hypothetical protein